MFSSQLEIESSNLNATLDETSQKVPRWRQQWTQRLMQSFLQRVIPRTPVATGRARSAWVTSLEELGGTAPAGWQGSARDATALSEGANASTVQQSQETNVTSVAVTNGVPYITLLEQGTESRSPQLMVVRSLSELRAELPALIPPLFE